MLLHRLIFGTLMTLLFIGLILADAWLDGSLLASQIPRPIQGSILCLLLAVLSLPALIELSVLAERSQAYIFKAIALPAILLVATSSYLTQFFPNWNGHRYLYIPYVLFMVMFISFLLQAIRFGTLGVQKNCAATLFSVFYLGLLCSFVPSIRIEFGPWAFLMFIFTVKCSDIGAYAIGSMIGKHKLVPTISPGKTWEGLAGAVLLGGLTGVSFAAFCGIMTVSAGAIFGILFSILGQMGDLAESMLKRDAIVKDSAKLIPGFGGILDVIDSPLATAPAAYAFFIYCCRPF